MIVRVIDRLEKEPYLGSGGGVSNAGRRLLVSNFGFHLGYMSRLRYVQVAPKDLNKKRDHGPLGIVNKLSGQAAILSYVTLRSKIISLCFSFLLC